VDDEFVGEQGAADGSNGSLPFWAPEPYDKTFSVSVERAIAAGLTFRPFADTVRETLEWSSTRADHEWRAGLTPERERDMLAAWHEKTGKTGTRT
jgi:2'-hydroxyisoflavone reductase